MGGGRAAVQVAGGGQHVAAGTDGDEPRAGPDVREGRSQLVGQPALVVHRAQLVRGRYHHRVGGGQQFGAVLDVDREIGVRAHGPGGEPAREDLVQRPPGRVLGPPEDPVRDAELEGEQPGEGEDDDAVRQRLHGPIVPKHDSQATVVRHPAGRRLSA